MLAKTLNSTVDINHLLSKPMYIATDTTRKPAIKGSMRTDICIVDELTKTVTSIDAKYYQATTPENASGWRYLVKQFFYEKALGTLPKYSTYNIKNILILPGKNSIFHQIRMSTSVQLHRLTFC